MLSLRYITHTKTDINIPVVAMLPRLLEALGLILLLLLVLLLVCVYVYMYVCV